MDQQWVTVQPETAQRIKARLLDERELACILQSLGHFSQANTEAKRLENMALRQINKRICQQQAQKQQMQKQKQQMQEQQAAASRQCKSSIFFFNNVSSPDSQAAPSPMGSPPQMLGANTTTKSDNIAKALLKRNNTNGSLHKTSRESSSSNLSVHNVTAGNATKSLFNNHNYHIQQQNASVDKAALAHDKRVQSTTSLFAKHTPAKTTSRQLYSDDDGDHSDSDSDSEWISSEWSSDSFDDDDENEEDVQDGVRFQKTEELPPPSLQRSLLSGMLLDKAKTSTDHSEDVQGGNKNPQLKLSPLQTRTSSTTSLKSISPLLKATTPPKLSGIPNALTSRQSSTGQTQQQQQQHLQAQPQHQAHMRSLTSQTSLSRLNKSSASLTSFYATNRRPNKNSNNGSNAPPSATTILPIALSTHMFLPTRVSLNQHQHYAHGHANPHSQLQRQKSNGLLLTHDNLKQLASTHLHHAHALANGRGGTVGTGADTGVETYTHSLKTETESVTSIDIPGKNNARQNHIPAVEFLTDEVWSRELPANLVNSLFNENKSGLDLKNNDEIYHYADEEVDNKIHTEEKLKAANELDESAENDEHGDYKHRDDLGENGYYSQGW